MPCCIDIVMTGGSFWAQRTMVKGHNGHIYEGGNCGHGWRRRTYLLIRAIGSLACTVGVLFLASKIIKATKKTQPHLAGGRPCYILETF
jgi:hypothetical protein